MSCAWRKAGTPSKPCPGRRHESETEDDPWERGSGQSRRRWRPWTRPGTSWSGSPKTELAGDPLSAPFALPAELRGLSEWVILLTYFSWHRWFFSLEASQRENTCLERPETWFQRLCEDKNLTWATSLDCLSTPKRVSGGVLTVLLNYQKKLILPLCWHVVYYPFLGRNAR